MVLVLMLPTGVGAVNVVPDTQAPQSPVQVPGPMSAVNVLVLPSHIAAADEVILALFHTVMLPLALHAPLVPVMVIVLLAVGAVKLAGE